ncbi:hypothetical protein ACWC5I_34580, partial [Kitasatospora sp. NPDC001574]
MSENHHVLLLDFTDRESCRAAFEDAEHLPGLRQSAIVERLADGTLDFPHLGPGLRRAQAGLPTRSSVDLPRRKLPPGRPD